jgi:hypothetical protein
MASSIYKRQTHPLVREGAPQKQDRNCQPVINIYHGLQMGLDTKTYWLIDRQSQCDFDFDFDFVEATAISSCTIRHYQSLRYHVTLVVNTASSSNQIIKWSFR